MGLQRSVGNCRSLLGVTFGGGGGGGVKQGNEGWMGDGIGERCCGWGSFMYLCVMVLADERPLPDQEVSLEAGLSIVRRWG